MDKIYVKARAKINLNLQVTGLRPDNYHNIESVFQKINLYDEIHIEKNDKDKIILKTNIEELNNEKNIVFKAYTKMKELYPAITGVNVIINKNIPMQAGLAGGSTDCASFILAINKLFDLKLSKEELTDIGKSLGADVVPCLFNKAVKAEGIGEIITPINTNSKYYIIIIQPDFCGNTKEMYRKIDEKKHSKQENTTNQIINGLENNNIKLVAQNLYNEFEEVIEEKNIVNEIKSKLNENKAMGSLMTGSGSCIYGIFEAKQDVKYAYYKLKEEYEKIYLCKAFNSERSMFKRFEIY